MGKRKHYIILTVVLLAVEVLIALFVHDRFIRPYVGDMLVVVVIYTFVRIWIPDSVRLLPLYVFLFAVGVEILQYFNIVELLGVQDNAFLRTIIGTSFDIKCALGNSNPLFYKASEISEITFSPLFFTFIL